MKTTRVHTISFRHAWDGLIYAIRTQPNFIIHLVISTLVITAGVLFALSPIEWIILSFTISLGLVIELINTSIESVVDLITDHYHPLAKIAKDTSAAAMLVYALGSIIIASLIFLPKLWHFI